MYKILFCCRAGVTTHMLVNSVKEEANNRGLDIVVWAVAESAIELSYADADVLFLAPQTASSEDKIRTMINGLVPIEVINQDDFKKMDGKAVLDRALEIIEKK